MDGWLDGQMDGWSYEIWMLLSGTMQYRNFQPLATEVFCLQMCRLSKHFGATRGEVGRMMSLTKRWIS